MNKYQQFWVFAVAMTAYAYAYGPPPSSGYGAPGNAASDSVSAAAAGEYQLAQSGSAGASADSISASASAGGDDLAQGSSYGSSDQNVPYAPANTKGNTVTSSITYPQNKGEILIHRPAPIIVKRPPTKVLVNHPPLVVKPAPVVLHKPPAVVLRKVYVKYHPRPVKVEPVYVNVVKPPAEKYFVNEKQQQYAAASQYAQGQSAYGPPPQTQTLPAYATGANDAAANAGYQLLQGNQGLAALASLGGNSDNLYSASSNAYVPPPAPGSYPQPSAY